MTDRILTTHVGSLPRPEKLIAAAHERTVNEKADETAFEKELKGAVVDVVRRQKEAGIDLINDGELGHTMGWAYDYGSWWSYVVRRLAGVEVVKSGLWKKPLAPRQKGSRPTILCSAIGAIAGISTSLQRPTAIRSPGATCPSSS